MHTIQGRHNLAMPAVFFERRKRNMNVNQIYSVLNQINAEMYGDSAGEVVDLAGFVSMGDTVLANQQGRDKFLNTLYDRIAKTVIRNLDLEIEYPTLMRNTIEYGAIVQKLSVNPRDAKQRNDWNVGTMSADDVATAMFSIDKPEVRQKFFSGVNAWEIDTTLPDRLFKTAFTSPEAMGAFINAIMAATEDSVIMSINNTNRYAVNNFIGEKIHSGQNVVHLITEYNNSDITTIATAIVDKGFLRFASKKIADVIRYMNVPSMLFNEEGAVRRTARDNMHVILNGDFASSVKTYLESDTFHNELVSLPYYVESSAWQLLGETADSETSRDYTAPNATLTTTLNIKTASGSTVNKAGVIGVIADRDAIATTVYERETTADRLNRLSLTQRTDKVNIGYLNDLSENGCIFVLD